MMILSLFTLALPLFWVPVSGLAVTNHPGPISARDLDDGNSSTADAVKFYFTTTLDPTASLESGNWTEINGPPGDDERAICIDCPCVIDREVAVEVREHGTWWTSWCHHRDAVNPDGVVLITQFKATTVTWTAGVGITLPMLGKAIKAKVGASVEISKGVGSSVGCHGDHSWSGPHGVYFQEKMGWANLKITETFTTSGGPQWSLPKNQYPYFLRFIQLARPGPNWLPTVPAWVQRSPEWQRTLV
ncbi:hypothetical protein CTA2_4647 [Colletotrichum tanaceti]|uniref:Uncharacterized protein n=1 Tax=Colletotrichum tanaceti TaxID=1306861 RepID=A0A4U6X7C1_9PEZI|nr:hypothetical protein CTA2_4647 [Colletotrichum tanaceti]TKW51380.1 hypothetical protein CTA1_7047 [Colletotrichum tanaceti]